MVATREALDAVWEGLRIVVVDLETVRGSDLVDRIIQVGIVVLRDNVPVRRWEATVNPGVPVDAKTGRIHGISDRDVRLAEPFSAYAPDIAGLVAERPGETVVLLAHRTRYDIPILRREMEAAGHPLPDLPLLDTQAGLATLGQVTSKNRRLATLLTEFGVEHTGKHRALADAEATADLARILIERAVSWGVRSAADLTRQADDSSVSTVAFSPIKDSKEGAWAERIVPPRHLASHSTVLTAIPKPRTLELWLRSVEECVSLRCDLLADRVAATSAAPFILLPPLLDMLGATSARRDAPGTATLLGAVMPLLEFSTPAKPGTERRTAARKMDKQVSAILAGLPRCLSGDGCPRCRAGAGCPIDVWREGLAPLAVGGPLGDMAKGYFQTTPTSTHSMAYTILVGKGHRPLADAGLRLVQRHWRETGQAARADMVADLGWQTGCRDPEITEAYASALAFGGREADLALAASVCEEALTLRDGNSDPAWTILETRHAQVLGLIERGRRTPTGKLDEAGNPIYVRRHRAVNPRRSRPPRFLRHRPTVEAPADEPESESGRTLFDESL